MGQFILGIIGMLIAGIILLQIEYGSLPAAPGKGSSSLTASAEREAADLKRQLKAEEEAAALKQRLETARIERENRAREAALQVQRERAAQEAADSQRRRQAEMAERERQAYIDNYRKTHGGCDPGYNRYCTYVGGMVAGCSCM